MKRLLLILVFISHASCQNSNELNNSYFFNTVEYHNVRCGDYLSQSAWVFELDSSKKIYSCSSNVGTEFIISDNNLIKNNEKLSFPNEQIFPWTLTYDNKEIIGIRTFSKDSLDKTELVSINIETKSLNRLIDLPNSNYWFTEHPLSATGKLAVQHNTRQMFLYDLKNRTYSDIEFETSNGPVISKDGMEILYVDNETVYLYNIKQKTSEELYSSKKERDYSVFRAFFGADNQILIKGIKYPDIKPLQKILYLEVDKFSKKILGKGNMSFKNGYRYK